MKAERIFAASVTTITVTTIFYFVMIQVQAGRPVIRDTVLLTVSDYIYILLMGAVILIFPMAIGLGLYVMVRRHTDVKWWHGCLAGLLVPIALSALLGSTSVQETASLAAAGLCGGFIFWLSLGAAERKQYPVKSDV